MPKISNKTINYSVYVNNDGRVSKIDDTTEVKLPEVEMLSDTIKGSGILGEVDFPTFLQPGSMGLEISMRTSNEKLGDLIGAHSLEIRWVTDVFDTNNIKVGINAHKAFIQCINKKFDEGKVAMGEAQEGSLEYEVFAYKRTINGKEILNIDKFNGIFAINGKNLSQDIQNAL
ncbi:phage major tail tube protein [Hathewaya massiliensis]|uniref:phage major tail tube protein n=1 Tax=Hathewaya massiliensis TaxID=1964382 RepID=UPI0011580E26|nr:phage major tail tube protein [Hathewaya massiliensis]